MADLKSKYFQLRMSSKGTILGAMLIIFVFSIYQVKYMRFVFSQNIAFIQSLAEMNRATANSFLSKNDMTSACDLLQVSVNKNFLKYFIIQLNGLSICAGPEKYKSVLDIEYKDFGTPKEADGTIYLSEKFGAYIVTTGTVADNNFNFFALEKAKLSSYFFGTALMLGIIWLITFILSRPLARQLQTFAGSSSEKRNFIDFLGSSIESQKTERAAIAFGQQQELLKSELSFIAPDFSSYLVKKYKVDVKEKPFAFSGTVLRFDLNDYTKLYFANNKETILQIISALAVEIDEIVSRYDGMHYAFGGDEFLDVFDGDDSARKAFFCIRAVFSALDNSKLSDKFGTRVKFKASLSTDKRILFGRIPQCYTLTSDALIMSARYLTAIEKKDTHSLIFGEAEKEKLLSCVDLPSAEYKKFKNIDTEVPVYTLEKFYSFEKFLNAESIPYLRSNEDIVDLLKALQSSMDQNLKNQIVASFKKFKVSVCSTDVVVEWQRCLNFIDMNSTDYYFISNFITAAKNLIPKNQWDDLLTNSVKALESLTNPRVEADVIELLFNKMNPEAFSKFLESFNFENRPDTFRTAGNILIAKSAMGLEQSLFRELEKHLNSSNPYEVATGIFAASKIILIYRKSDPVALSQFLEVDKILKTINTLKSSKNEMVRSRAQVEMVLLDS